LTITAALLALAPAATAATPFTAGAGSGQDLAVGSDGTGHVVWVTDEAADRIGYCRVPAGGTACDSESGFLTFPSGTSPSSPSPHAQVFTPAPNKVVILASCTNCTGIAQRTYRFISTNNGVSFDAGTQVGNLALNGQADYIDTGNVALSVEASDFQAQVGPSPGTTTQLALGQSPLYVYDASVAVDPGGTRAVYAVDNLNAVAYRVFQDPWTPGITAAELNNVANWSGSLVPLSSPESDNRTSALLRTSQCARPSSTRWPRPVRMETASRCGAATRARSASFRSTRSRSRRRRAAPAGVAGPIRVRRPPVASRSATRR
jgi:hypothetical protein